MYFRLDADRRPLLAGDVGGGDRQRPRHARRRACKQQPGADGRDDRRVLSRRRRPGRTTVRPCSLGRGQPDPRHPGACRPEEHRRRRATRADARQRRDGHRPPPERARVRRADRRRWPAPSPSGSRPSRPTKASSATTRKRQRYPPTRLRVRDPPQPHQAAANRARRRHHTRHRPRTTFALIHHPHEARP